MLEKIIKIQNVGRFVNYSATGDTTLQKLSLIYGANGSGKSTLTQVLRSLKTGNASILEGRKTLGASNAPVIQVLTNGATVNFNGSTWTGTKDNIEIYDTVFTKDNVHSGYVDHEQKKSLYLFAIGEESVRLANRISEIDGETRSLSQDITAKEGEIKQKFTGYNITLANFLNITEVADIDSQIALQRGLVNGISKAEEIKNKSLVKAIPFPNEVHTEVETLIGQSIEDIEKDAEVKVKEHLRDHLGENSLPWVEQGYHYLGDQDDCPFCGQNTAGAQLVTAYKNYFHEAYTAFIEELEEKSEIHKAALSVQKLYELKQLISGNNLVTDFWYNVLPTKPERVLLNLEALEKIWNDLTVKITHHLGLKKSDPLTELAFNEDISASIVEFTKCIAEVQQYNDWVVEINKLIEAYKLTITKSDLQAEKASSNLLELTKIRHISEVKALCTSYSTSVDKKAALQREKTEKKAASEALTTSELTAYGASINRHLGYMANFKLSDTTCSYRGGNPSIHYAVEIMGHTVELGDHSSPENIASFKNTLSDGDKSSLALSFFLPRLDHDPNIANKIIVFDDPITSLDKQRRQYTTNQIIGIATKAKQVIVLTHNLEFASDLNKMAKEKSVPIKPLLTNPFSMTQSKIEPWEIDEETKEQYLKDFDTLCEFITTGTTDTISAGRAIRPVLEGYFKMRFPRELKDQKMMGNILETIRAAKASGALPLSNVSDKQFSDAEIVNEYSRTIMHSSSGVVGSIDVPELQKMIQVALSIIQ